ncbi:MAG: lytic transglycosylase domain-containing protein, partial [Sphingomonas sp.]|nr:lytic transglycosylase domain-containing protein [Sphingomonas sp.]
MLICLPFFAGTATAQVIEIDENGESRTFDGPATFALSVDQPAEIASVSSVPHSDAFERAAATHGVDVNLLRAVAWTESRGRNNAVSPKGALGIMQLMPGTAAELGVNPLDANSNIAGGAMYLARQISQFRNIPLALAAYNAGPGAVMRWRGIPPYAETQSYVTSVLRRWGGQAGPLTAMPTALAGRSLPPRKASPAAVASTVGVM